VTSTVAIEVFVLLHVPPPASLNTIAAPTHIGPVPLIADGGGLTEIVVVAAQPVASV
jgi:hypothetical protein